MFSFKLYTTGLSERNLKFTDSLKEVLDLLLNGQYQLKAIDVIEDPHSALQDNVLVTPTLIKYEPAPVLRIAGAFADVDVLKGLMFK